MNLAGLTIDDYHMPHLLVQNGHLDRMTISREVWVHAYKAHLLATYKTIRPCLPERCERILDIGGGMGGIDILLAKHYGDQLKEICIIDGESDAPVLHTHDQTFSDWASAESFLTTNGVAPDVLRFVSPVTPDDATGDYDLVLSLASWCFHYAPERYLRLVNDRTHAGSRLILDVRRSHPDWLMELTTHFSVERRKLCWNKKFERIAFRV